MGLFIFAKNMLIFLYLYELLYHVQKPLITALAISISKPCYFCSFALHYCEKVIFQIP